WIGAEDRGIHVDVDIGFDISETTATLSLDGALDFPPPQEFPGAGGLQLTCDRYRSGQIQIQAFESRIVRRKFPHRPYRAALKVPDVHSQHSRLK
ncbi:MAG TPA: hypothetical protein VJU17_07925, partial [Gemmatimonadales bacterium]|nr:hypothetical protein [Gemmatimonadales bacterium]